MTLAAVWCSYETPQAPTLWMASDSRIGDAHGALIDEGIKLFPGSAVGGHARLP